MPFTVCQDKMRTPTTDSTPLRRRLTLSAHGSHTILALKRAINISTFIAPTVITLHGHGVPGGKRNIYLSAGIQRHLKKLYDSLKRGDPTLSRAKFKNFLETQQGEVAVDLTEERYKFEQFLELWYLRFGVDAEKPAPAKDKDLERPISNYFISSSHNTYLSGNQLSGRSTADAYRRALLQGCRCVEIDVWNADSPNSSRDRSQDASTKKPEHKRAFSGESRHSYAAHLKAAAEYKLEKTRRKLGVEKVHSHSPKCSQTGFLALPSPPLRRESSQTLEWSTAADRFDAERLWMGSRPALPPDEPIVMHGYTLTAPVGFRDVCKAIREVAFEKTDLPIIVSLEVHAGKEQQETMVQIMKQEWAGLLVAEPHDSCPNGAMPRLGDLRKKIMIKVKRASPCSDSFATMSSLTPNVTQDDDASASDDDRTPTPNGRSKPKVQICEMLSALAIYTHSEHFTNFESPAAKIPSHIFSISESKIQELLITKSKEVFAHNRQFFMRAYPRSLRVDSSNLDPSQFWRNGVQMVAMNWQSSDEGMMLNRAMFSGEDGWVLKPPGYLSEEDSVAIEKASPIRTFDLIVEVLSGQYIPWPEGYTHANARNFRPLVKCELHVEKAEGLSGSLVERSSRLREADCKKKTGSAKTDHPEFDPANRHMRFTGIQMRVEQLSFVRFKVEDDASRVSSIKYDPFAAWACIRLDRLATGYRFVHLLDRNGEETRGKLLVRIEKNFRKYS